MSGHLTIGEVSLSRSETIALADCETRIERGMKTFLEVGMALSAIRENKLYRISYETFEEYCSERWGFTGRRGRQLIEAAEIGTVVPIENEGQARALGKVPEAERADVWREAVERTDGKPTAAAVREVHEERTRPTPSPGPVDAAATPPVDPGATPECLGVDMDCGRPMPVDSTTLPADPGAAPAPAAGSPRAPVPSQEPAQSPEPAGPVAAGNPAGSGPNDAERAAAAVQAALDRFVPDPGAPARAWQKELYVRLKPVHTFLLWLKTEDVTAFAGEHDVTTLRHLATSFTDAHRRAVDASTANVTQLRRIK